MSDQALIVRHDAGLAVAFTDEARQQKALILDAAIDIERVSTPEEQAVAVGVQKSIKAFLDMVEAQRTKVKAPLLDACRELDGKVKEFVGKVNAEQLRIARLVGDFQQAELARVRSEEARRQKELAEIERKREEECAKAKSIEERERIREDFSQQVAAVQPPPAPAKAEGQRVTETWEFEVMDASLLARCHYPEMCKVEPRRAEIKAALQAGRSVQGVRAWKVVNATVRAEREQEAITV